MQHGFGGEGEAFFNESWADRTIRVAIGLCISAGASRCLAGSVWS